MTCHKTRIINTSKLAHVLQTARGFVYLCAYTLAIQTESVLLFKIDLDASKKLIGRSLSSHKAVEEPCPNTVSSSVPIPSLPGLIVYVHL